jgi:hypothetical protein
VAERSDRGEGRTTRVLTTAGVLVGLIGGALGLLFTLQPQLRPCLGEAGASFTGAPVFPHVHFRDHLVRTGVRRENAAREPNLLGAEVRFSYRATGLRGHTLPITWSLVMIRGRDTLGAVVAGQDRSLAMTVTPDTCTETGGKDLFVPVPFPRRRYRVVLEMYRNQALNDRLELTETQIFAG